MSSEPVKQEGEEETAEKTETQERKESTGSVKNNERQVEKKPSMVETLTKFWSNKCKDKTDDILISPLYLFWTESGGQKVIRVHNRTDECKALKMKCSDNTVYKVHPVFAVLPPRKSVDIQVTRNPGPLKLDKVVVCHTRFTDVGSKLAAFFKVPGLEVATEDVAMLQRVNPSA